MHLYSLTLEDILQRERREKLRKLGYYFIIFRAIEYTTRNELLEIVNQKTGQFPASCTGVLQTRVGMHFPSAHRIPSWNTHRESCQAGPITYQCPLVADDKNFRHLR